MAATLDHPVTFPRAGTDRLVSHSMPRVVTRLGRAPRRLPASVVAALLLALTLIPSGANAQVPGEARLRKTITKAVGVAGLPASLRVVAIDPQLAADPGALEVLDAFVVREADGRLRPVVYLNARSELMQHAARGSRVHLHLLAAVIVHETHHLEGASEAEARRGEAAFIERLVREQRVSPQVADRYLEELNKAMRLISEQTQ